MNTPRSSSVHVEIEGLEELQKLLQRAKRESVEEVFEAGADITLDLLGESARRAPVETGDLRGSGFAEINGRKIGGTDKNGNVISLTGYMGRKKDFEGVVGFESFYALYQHEGVEFNHPLGGEAKYLENPLKSKTNAYIKLLGDAVKKVIE